jgi:hypothetical protein
VTHEGAEHRSPARAVASKRHGRCDAARDVTKIARPMSSPVIARAHTLSLAVCLLTACRPASSRGAPPAADVVPASEAAVRVAAPPPSGAPARWTLSPRDAQAHGFAALGFSLDQPPRSMIATRFPAQGTLALFSGPPGGPLGALVEVDNLSGSDVISLRDALRTAVAVRIGNPRVIGEPERVNFAGALHDAVSLLAGNGPARTQYCVVMVPAPVTVPQGLLVWLYISGLGVVTPSCASVLAHPAMNGFATGFQLDPG